MRNPGYRRVSKSRGGVVALRNAEQVFDANIGSNSIGQALATEEKRNANRWLPSVIVQPGEAGSGPCLVLHCMTGTLRSTNSENGPSEMEL
jgi:hypothetical protein